MNTIKIQKNTYYKKEKNSIIKISIGVELLKEKDLIREKNRFVKKGSLLMYKLFEFDF